MMRIKSQRIRDAGALTTYIGNSIFILENSDSRGCETLETPNISLFPSVLQVKVEVPLFNLESLFFYSNRSCYFFLEKVCFRFGDDLLL